MINLRYHIVSLTAVFLALGLGVLAGTTVIDQRVVESLEANTRALQNTIKDRDAEIGVLKAQIALFEGLSDAVVPGLLRGRLPGASVALLTDGEVPGEVVQNVSETLILAGARRATRLAFSDRWALDQPATIQQLATVIGSTDTDRDKLIGEAASRLASRLAGSGDARAEGDLIRAFENSGFIDVTDLPQTGAFPASDTMVVVVTSGAESSSPDEDAFFVPLLRKLSSSRVIGVVEPMDAQRSFAEKIRGDRTLSQVICTIDHVDTPAGRLSLVYALRDRMRGRPAEHFGVREGADSVAPDVGAA